MTAVLKREFKSYFTSMIGYVFIAFMVLVIGIFTWVICLRGGYADFEMVFGNASFVLLIAVPILTMSVFAAERHNKTDQLLLTAPVRVSKIVAGKYLGMAAVLALPILLFCLYPPLLAQFGNVPYARAYCMLIGFFLTGALLIAIGMFLSSLTESTIVSAILTLAVLLLLFWLDDLASQLPSSSAFSLAAFIVLALVIGFLFYQMTKNVLWAAIVAGALVAGLLVLYFANASLLEGTFTRFLEAFCVFKPMNDSFINGIFDIGAVVYYLSGIFLFNLFTVQSIQKRRWA